MIKMHNINEWPELKTDGSVLIDVRTDDEFQSGHLSDCLHMNIQGPDFASQIEKLDKDKDYFLYCRSGMRSAMAAGAMIRSGFESVANLEGGILAWKGEVEL